MVTLTAEDEIQNIYENLLTAFENVKIVKNVENWKDERILKLEAENKKLNDWIRKEKLKKIERILKIDYNDLIDTLSSNLNRLSSRNPQSEELQKVRKEVKEFDENFEEYIENLRNLKNNPELLRIDVEIVEFPNEEFMEVYQKLITNSTNIINNLHTL